MITASRTVDKFLTRDFYSIENICGVKSIHIHGYFFTEGPENIPGKPFRSVEYSGAYIPLEEFLKTDRENISEFLSGVKQSEDDLSEEETMKAIKNYYGSISNGKYHPLPWKGLPYEELTMDTPYGDYCDVKMERSPYRAGDKFHISGDINLDDYDVRVDTDGEILMDQKPGETLLLCTLYYVDGDCNVTAYVDVKDMKAVA